MSISPRLFRIFYKSTEQRLKILNGTPQSDILDLIKRSFHINEDLWKIILQDGDLICLPPKIPNGLCVYVYIEPDLRPTLFHETDHLFIDSATSVDQQSNGEQTSNSLIDTKFNCHFSEKFVR